MKADERHERRNLQQSAINKNNNKNYEMRSELEKKNRQGVLYSYTIRARWGLSVRRSIKIRVMCPRLRENTVMPAAVDRARLRRGCKM